MDLTLTIYEYLVKLIDLHDAAVTLAGTSCSLG